MSKRVGYFYAEDRTIIPYVSVRRKAYGEPYGEKYYALYGCYIRRPEHPWLSIKLRPKPGGHIVKGLTVEADAITTVGKRWKHPSQ